MQPPLVCLFCSAMYDYNFALTFLRRSPRRCLLVLLGTLDDDDDEHIYDYNLVAFIYDDAAAACLFCSAPSTPRMKSRMCPCASANCFSKNYAMEDGG